MEIALLLTSLVSVGEYERMHDRKSSKGLIALFGELSPRVSLPRVSISTPRASAALMTSEHSQVR